MKKIIALSLNPSIDKRYVADNVCPGSAVRVKCVNSAGGKGVNVARVLTILGADVTAAGIIGGYNGGLLTQLLDRQGVAHNFFRTERETRSCINLYDKQSGSQTEFLEAGETLAEREVAAFMDYFSGLLHEDVFLVVMSGSAMPGIPPDIYARLIRMCAARGIKTILDTSGIYLTEGIKAKPFMVKPNADEIAQLNITARTERGIIDTAKAYAADGISQFAVSLGENGSIMATNAGVLRATSAPVRTVNTVGCGDSMIAGFAYAEVNNMNYAEKLSFATKTAVANAMQESTGFIDVRDLDGIRVEISECR